MFFSNSTIIFNKWLIGTAGFSKHHPAFISSCMTKTQPTKTDIRQQSTASSPHPPTGVSLRQA